MTNNSNTNNTLNANEYEELCNSLLRDNGFNIISVNNTNNRFNIVAKKDNLRYGINFKYGSDVITDGAIKRILDINKSYQCDVIALLSCATVSESAVMLANEKNVKIWRIIDNSIKFDDSDLISDSNEIKITVTKKYKTLCNDFLKSNGFNILSIHDDKQNFDFIAKKDNSKYGIKVYIIMAK